MTKDDRDTQIFRATLPSGEALPTPTIGVTARRDKAGQQIVLWKEVQRVFENAKYIVKDGSVVSFMMDDDFEEISFHAGVVLDVIVESTTNDRSPQAIPSRPLFSAFPVPGLSAASESQSEQRLSSTNSMSNIPVDHPALSNVEEEKHLADLDNDSPYPQTGEMDQTIVALSTHLSADAKTSLYRYNKLYNSYFDAILAGQTIQAMDIKSAMKEHFSNLRVEMDKNKELQEKMYEMQREMNILQHQMAEKQRQMHEEQNQWQKQMHEQLVSIRARIECVITQTYELHEYPIPRLFIVLPKATRRRDRLGKPFSKQFRLFFLCECGSHTMSKPNQEPHTIHLAKHEGYDLDKPTEFFEKYGTYVLTMLQFIQFGIVTATIVVPPLANFKLVEGLEMVQASLDLANNTVGALVDESISYIQQQKPGNIDVPKDGIELNKQEVLEGADLRQLESYLNIQDQGRVLGNLYRIVTPEGHVKWVCMDHYRENYRQQLVQQLREFVEAHEGTFNEQRGIVDIKIATKYIAAQFFDALNKARGVRQLIIKLNWDATMEDLRHFANAVSIANIIHLSLDGSSFKGPAIDVVNRGRRYDPIFQLMSTGWIQSLHLKGFEDFFLRISNLTSLTGSKLRELSIDSKLQLQRHMKTERSAFKSILQGCPLLTKLTLGCYHITKVFACFLDLAPRTKKLVNLNLICSGLNVNVTLSEGKINTVEADVYWFLNLADDDYAFLQKGHLTNLAVRRTPQAVSLDEPLTKLMSGNPQLSMIDIAIQDESYHHIIELVSSTREKIISEGSMSVLQKLGLHRGEWDEGDTGDYVTMTIDFTDTIAGFQVTSEIKMRDMIPQPGTKMKELFRLYGWSIVFLSTNDLFSDLHVALLGNAMDTKSLKLQYLTLTLTSLTSIGLGIMDWIISQSKDLQELTLVAGELEDVGQQHKAQRLLQRHGGQLYGLTLKGLGSAWISNLGSQFLTRQAFPAMGVFVLDCIAREHIPHQCVRWIAAIISAPGAHDSWSPLEDIALRNMHFEPKDWQHIIKTLDFFTVETLCFDGTNFSVREFELLMDGIPDDGADVSLRNLHLRASDITEDPQAAGYMRGRMDVKAPRVAIWY
ncbi:hypothetical protein BGX28_002538 [Mortierella sp. GBA30]|nr:hypothetical protein BGX28_002538 [Mortierella sp. GBA30]